MANEVEPSYVLPVVDVVHETADAVSDSLGIPDEHREVFAFRPGQFLTLAIPSDTMGLVARCYSMSSTPLRPDPVTVTVKRTPEGFGSIWVHDHLRVGDKVRVLAPSGIFTPRSLDDDLLLFGAGSGITPIMSIIRTALSPVEAGGGTGRLALFYANRDRASVIFHDALAALAQAHPERLQVEHWLEDERGLPGSEPIAQFATSYSSWNSFCCGPKPYMAAVAGVLKELGFPRERRHQERFVSLGGNPFGSPDEAGGPPTGLGDPEGITDL